MQHLKWRRSSGKISSSALRRYAPAYYDRYCHGIAAGTSSLLMNQQLPIDAVTQYEILEEFVRIKKNKNTAMLFITHDLGAISKVADRILVMNSGQIVDSGDFEHIRNHANDPYTRLLIEKRSAVMCHYRDILHGKEISHA